MFEAVPVFVIWEEAMGFWLAFYKAATGECPWILENPLFPLCCLFPCCLLAFPPVVISSCQFILFLKMRTPSFLGIKYSNYMPGHLEVTANGYFKRWSHSKFLHIYTNITHDGVQTKTTHLSGSRVANGPVSSAVEKTTAHNNT